MKTVLKNIGKALAKIAVYAAKGAVWASDHQEVIAVVGSVVHVDPKVAVAVEGAIKIAGAVKQAK